MKSKGRTRYLTQDEESRLLAALPEGVKRDAAMFLLDTGARVNEALTLTWEDLAHHQDFARVTFYRTKNGRARTVPLTARAADCLRRARAEGRSRPFPVAYHAMWVAFDKARKAAALGGSEALVVHSLRHTCASRLVQRGAALHLVKDWLGHSSLDLTLRYSHLATDALNPLAGLLESCHG